MRTNRLDGLSKTKTRKFGDKTFYFYGAFHGGKPTSQVNALKKEGGSVRVLKKKTEKHGTHYEVWARKA